MKYCDKCGASLRDDARFCNNCGSKITVSNAMNDAKTELGTDISPEAIFFENSGEVQQPQKPKRKKRTPKQERKSSPRVDDSKTFYINQQQTPPSASAPPEDTSYRTLGERDRNSGKRLWIVLLLVFIALAVFGAILYFILSGGVFDNNSQNTSISPDNAVRVTIAPTPVATPNTIVTSEPTSESTQTSTPTPTVNVADYNINDYLGYWSGYYYNNSGLMNMYIDLYDIEENGSSSRCYAIISFEPGEGNSSRASGEYGTFGEINLYNGHIWMDGVMWISDQPEGYNMLSIIGNIKDGMFTGELQRDYLPDFELWR